MSYTTLHDYLADRPARFAGVRRCQWPAVLGAALVASVVFAGLTTLLRVVAYGDSPWTIFHMIAAMPLGREALDNPEGFDLAIVGAAAAVHLVLSAIYGVALCQIAIGMARAAAIPLGLAAGAALYFVNFHIFTAIFPWFGALRSLEMLFTHMIAGAVLVATYWVFHSERRERFLML